MRQAPAQAHRKACKHTRSQAIKGRQGGMTLLEVLVALAIMAMALGMIYRVAGGAARSSADIVQRQQATAIAQSLLASRNAVLPEGWNEQGQSGDFSWRAESTPWAAPVSSPETIALQQVRLTVSWTQGARPGQITLDTLLPQRKPLPHEVAR